MLTIYRDEISFREPMNAIEESFNDRCKYYASDLIDFLELNDNTFIEALEKAQLGLNTLHIPIRYNIRKIFRVSELGIKPDIKLSPLAAYFLAIHLDPTNPLAARLQYYFAERYGY